jgi:hypothetical protein
MHFAKLFLKTIFLGIGAFALLDAARILKSNAKSFLAWPGYISRRFLGPAGERALLRVLGSQHKWFIRPELTIAGFFDTLRRREISYVVLRWFEALPDIDKGHDIDILIADEHVCLVQDLLTNWPIGQRCDVYSTTGLAGFSYRLGSYSQNSDGMPVFPPHLAEQILRRGRLHNGLVRVPAPNDHFFSLAYHAIYLKGALQGSHDYRHVLANLAASLGVVLPHPITLETLDDVLADHGWRPSLTVLAELSHSNNWIAEKFFVIHLESGQQRAQANGGLKGSWE